MGEEGELIFAESVFNLNVCIFKTEITVEMEPALKLKKRQDAAHSLDLKATLAFKQLIPGLILSVCTVKAAKVRQKTLLSVLKLFVIVYSKPPSTFKVALRNVMILLMLTFKPDL